MDGREIAYMPYLSISKLRQKDRGKEGRVQRVWGGATGCGLTQRREATGKGSQRILLEGGHSATQLPISIFHTCTEKRHISGAG